MKCWLVPVLLCSGFARPGLAQAPMRLEAEPLTVAGSSLMLAPLRKPAAVAIAPSPSKPAVEEAPIPSLAATIEATRTRPPSDFQVVAPSDYPTTGAFIGRPDVPVGIAPTALALGDVDGDGDLDFVTSTSYGNSRAYGIVKCLLNDGHGNFSHEQVIPVPQLSKNVALADTDGDGDLDLLSLNPSAVNVSIRLNDGHGQFGPGPDVAMSPNTDLASFGAILWGLEVRDFNGDGRPDFATTNVRDKTVALGLNEGHNSFRVATVPVLSPAINLAAGDFDGNGTPDLAVCLHGPQALGIFLNQGNASFSAGQKQEVMSRQMSAQVQAADLDNDGDLDLVTINGEELRLYYNDGRGTFLVDDQAIKPRLLPYSLAMCDLNADKYPDLLVACPAMLLIYLNNGHGQFGPTLDVVLGPQNTRALGLAVGDLDGDGIPDALLDSDVPTGSGGIVQVRLNRLPQVRARLRTRRRAARPASSLLAQQPTTQTDNRTNAALVDSHPTTAQATTPPLALYPNPTRSEAVLAGALPGAPVQVFDAIGQLVLVVEATSDGTALLRLPNGLAPGVYLVRTGGRVRRLLVE